MIELRNKINEALIKLDISKVELSRRLGKNKTYIQDILRPNYAMSTLKQMKLVLDIDSIIDGGTILNEEDLLDRLLNTESQLELSSQALKAERDEYKRLAVTHAEQFERLNRQHKRIDYFKSKINKIGVYSYICIFLAFIIGGLVGWLI